MEKVSNNQEEKYIDPSRSRSSKHSERSQIKTEEELKTFLEDPTKLPKEIMLLKKELSRLHYKIKFYHQQERLGQLVIGSITLILLLIIAFRVFGMG